jgi:carboxypeptidase Q
MKHLLRASAALLLLGFGSAFAQADTNQSNDPQLARIKNTALHSDWAFETLAALTDTIGPRLSGSEQLQQATQLMAQRMRALGAQVQLQPTKVDHWVRGQESATLTDYPGRPAQLTQTLHLTALGLSAATPNGGLLAPVIVVQNMQELHERSAEVKGAIVLFHERFDQGLADNGMAGSAYGQAGLYRFAGPSEAAKLGAAAALVRSVGGAEYRMPHTGVTVWQDKQPPIPAAALSAEDADLVDRLAAKGPVQMRLILDVQTLPLADSFNVIADWPGTDKANDYILVSGHLDSWDLGTGATDDGAGVAATAGVIQVLQQLNLHPRRSIRFVAWADEELGGKGSQTYAGLLNGNISQHCAVIESDLGGGHTMGIEASVSRADFAQLETLKSVLAPMGAGVFRRMDDEVGADIEPLRKAGVGAFAPLVDSRHYFDYHHTAADTLDKVKPADLQSQVATLAVLAYWLANRDSCMKSVRE